MPVSRRPFRALLGLAAGVVAAAALVQSAAAADLMRPAPVETVVEGLPNCTDEGVLSTIRWRFAYGAAHVEKLRLELVDIERIHQTDLQLGPSPVPRRLCGAEVSLSDGTRSRLAWRIEKSTGFAAPGLWGIHDGIDFCVVGHDPWRVHDGDCRALTRFW